MERLMKPLWVGEGNIAKVKALPHTTSLSETLAVAIRALGDGEIFFPFGDGKHPELYVSNTAYNGKGLTHLSLQGILKRLSYNSHAERLYQEVGAHVGRCFKARFPHLNNWECLSHEEVLTLLRVALRTPVSQGGDPPYVLPHKQKIYDPWSTSSGPLS